MSAIGTKQTYCTAAAMSAFGGKADISNGPKKSFANPNLVTAKMGYSVAHSFFVRESH